MSGNHIGDEGAKSMSEMIKVNTALTLLNLSRLKKGKKKEGMK